MEAKPMQDRIFKRLFDAEGPANRFQHANPVSPRVLRGLAALLCCVVAPSFAQEESELAKQVQNPLARLISVPFQNNFNFGVGPKEASQYILNVQPVIPFHLTDK